ncbi:MAG TPA: DUF4124 domain-containing protein [Steroidobacteraceae bacterium]|nr:DUF4124 domain-containing protein [Steroidobacteraceae bacterium]
MWAKFISGAAVSVGIALACASLAHAAANASSGKAPVTYRWVDENGVVHYGDRIPPQYAQKESEMLNNQGVEVGHRAAPKTSSQLDAEEHAEQLLLQQKQRDSFLLTTYTSVKDIEQLRDERLEQIKAQRVAAQQYVASLHERLLTLQARVLSFRPYSSDVTAGRMPDDLAEDMVHTLNEIRTQHHELAAKDKEQSEMRAQFQADIERYRELRAAATASR